MNAGEPGGSPGGPRPELCVGAVARRGHELLMVRRGRPPGRGRWSLPGGRVEAGESLAEAVVREVAEETGLVTVCGPLVGWVERLDAEHHYVILDFEVVVLDPGEPVAGDDALEASWVASWDVPELDLVEGLAEFLSDHDLIETIS